MKISTVDLSKLCQPRSAPHRPKKRNVTDPHDFQPSFHCPLDLFPLLSQQGPFAHNDGGWRAFDYCILLDEVMLTCLNEDTGVEINGAFSLWKGTGEVKNSF
ncbi:hypothetical protein AVEN_235327-1 [Araneus ventricosus]|uniref:Uncharacterized protein n=1 Tax=Araneus ventricosus TaxID=182803 RepID=A0A4Y2A3C3_ARAVE|nr:hypothetical protein AVEN_235327-1 [Araneus ventricosus]